MSFDKQIFWPEKYRPREIEDCVLPKSYRDMFTQTIEDGELPNYLFSSRTPGVGKTTIAKILCEKLGYEYIMINGSNDSNIDTLRNQIISFASSFALGAERKCIIIDEADHLNPNSTQPALRGVIEEFSNNCSFIFTCNQINKISKPIRSRFAIVDFDYSPKDSESLKMQMVKRCKYILDEENVEYDLKGLARIIQDLYPEFRTIIGALQRQSKIGKITYVDYNKSQEIKDLIGFLKRKSWKELRIWVEENSDLGMDFICNRIDKDLDNIVPVNKQAEALIIIYDYLYKSQFAQNQSICMMAMFSELMLSVNFKD